MEKVAILVRTSTNRQDNDIEFELHLFRLLKPLMQIREIIESDIELKKYFEHKFFSLISFNLALPF